MSNEDTGFLSQDQIDSMLAGGTTPPAAGDEKTAAAGSEQSGVALARYDFRRKERFSTEQSRTLELVYERFAKQLGAVTGAFLRTTSDSSLIEVKQITYGEFLMSLSETTAIWGFDVNPTGGTAAIELSPEAAYGLVYSLLGGRGPSVIEDRALTEIELTVLERVTEQILAVLVREWRAVCEAQFPIVTRDTRPQMLGVASSGDAFSVATFTLTVAETTGSFNLAFPVAAIEKMGLEATSSDEPPPPRDPEQADRWYKRLGKIPFPVTAQLESSIASADLLQLRVGDVVSFPVPATTGVEVHVTDRKKFHGRLCATDKRVQVAIEGAVG